MKAVSHATLGFAAALTISCAATPPPRKVPDEPLPTIMLSVDVQGNVIGVTGARGGMCNGEFDGTLAITLPTGAVDHVEVAHASDLAHARCADCNRDCDAPCVPAFAPFIRLASHPFSTRGEYTITPDLVLSCAPNRVRVTGAHVFSDGNGLVVPTRPGVVYVTPPAPPASTTTTASDVRLRFPHVDPLSGEVEGLAFPADPRDKARGVTTTRWGEVRTVQAGTPYLFVTGDHGPYWVLARSTPTAVPTQLALTDGGAHVVVLSVEQATPEALRASQSGGIVTSAWRVVDGAAGAGKPRAVSLDPSAALDDARARWTTFRGAQATAITAALAAADHDSPGKPFGPEKTDSESSFVPAWSPSAQRLLVRYVQRTTRWSEHVVSGEACPRNRPGPCTTVQSPEARAYYADVALELEYDQSGKLVAERPFPAHPVAAH